MLAILLSLFFCISSPHADFFDGIRGTGDAALEAEAPRHEDIAPNTSVGVARVTAPSGLNLRDEPHGRILRALLPDEEVEVLAIQGEWAQVRAGADEGWAAAEWISEPLTVGIVVAPSGLRLRNDPENGRILRKLSSQEEITIVQRNGDWLEVQTSDSARGYAHFQWIQTQPQFDWTALAATLPTFCAARPSLGHTLLEREFECPDNPPLSNASQPAVAAIFVMSLQNEMLQTYPQALTDWHTQHSIHEQSSCQEIQQSLGFVAERLNTGEVQSFDCPTGSALGAETPLSSVSEERHAQFIAPLGRSNAQAVLELLEEGHAQIASAATEEAGFAHNSEAMDRPESSAPDQVEDASPVDIPEWAQVSSGPVSEARRRELQDAAPMHLSGDRQLADSLGKHFLVTRDSGQQSRISDFAVTEMMDGVLHVQLTMESSRTTVNENRQEVRESTIAIYRLQLRPIRVDDTEDIWDFILESFEHESAESQVTEMTAEASELLASLASVLAEQDFGGALRFAWMPENQAFRVQNSLAMFAGFPRFQIQDVEIHQNQIDFFGDPAASELGNLVATQLHLTPQGDIAAPLSREEIVQPSQTLQTEASGVSYNGEIRARIHQSVINSFGTGFQTGVLNSARAAGFQDLDQREEQGLNLEESNQPEYEWIRHMMRGIETAELDFQQDSLNLHLEADLNLLAPQTRSGLEAFNAYVADVFNYVESRASRAGNAIARGAIHSWNWVTRRVGIDLQGDATQYHTNEEDFQPVSGNFSLILPGRLQTTDDPNELLMQLQFHEDMIRDTQNPGSLQKWLGRLGGTIEFFLNPFGVGDELTEVVLEAAGYTRGEDFQDRETMLELYLDIMARSTSRFMAEGLIPGLEIEADGYDRIFVRFEEFEAIPGVPASITGAESLQDHLQIQAAP